MRSAKSLTNLFSNKCAKVAGDESNIIDRYTLVGPNESAKCMDSFEEIKLEDALLEPNGFYTHLNSIDTKARKIVLLRLPKDFNNDELDGLTLKFAGKQLPLVSGCELYRQQEEPSIGLLVPGTKGLTVNPFDEMWTIISTGEEVKTTNVGQELNYDADDRVSRGERTRTRKQPDGLKMSLSTADLSTVINRPRRGVRVRESLSPEKSKNKSKSSAS